MIFFKIILFFFTVLVPCCRAMPGQPGANGAGGTGQGGAVNPRYGSGSIHRSELTLPGFPLSLGGYCSFLPGTCGIQ